MKCLIEVYINFTGGFDRGHGPLKKAKNTVLHTWFGGFNSITVEKKCCPLASVNVLCKALTLRDVAMTATSEPFRISDLKI